MSNHPRPTIVVSNPKPPPAASPPASRPMLAADQALAATAERTRILEILEAAKDAGESVSDLAISLIKDPSLSASTARNYLNSIKAERQFAAGIKAAGDHVQALGLIR